MFWHKSINYWIKTAENKKSKKCAFILILFTYCCMIAGWRLSWCSWWWCWSPCYPGLAARRRPSGWRWGLGTSRGRTGAWSGSTWGSPAKCWDLNIISDKLYVTYITVRSTIFEKWNDNQSESRNCYHWLLSQQGPWINFNQFEIYFRT